MHVRCLPPFFSKTKSHFEAAATPTQQHLHSAASPPSFSTPRSYLICRLHRAALIRKTGLLTAAALRSLSKIILVRMSLLCHAASIHYLIFHHSVTHYSVNLSQVSDQSRFHFVALIIFTFSRPPAYDISYLNKTWVDLPISVKYSLLLQLHAVVSSPSAAKAAVKGWNRRSWIDNASNSRLHTFSLASPSRYHCLCFASSIAFVPIR